MYNNFYRKSKGFGQVSRKPRKERIKKIISTNNIDMITKKPQIIRKNNKIKTKKITKEKRIIQRNEDLHNFKIPFINYNFKSLQ